MSYPAAPQIHQQEDVLLFLVSEDLVAGGYSIVGFSQGKFTLAEGPQGKKVATQDLSALNLQGRGGSLRPGTAKTIQLDELGVGNMLSEKPASLNADRRILRSVQHKCGNENRGQDIFDVDLAVHAHQTDHGGRTAAQSFKTAPPALEVRIALF